MDISWATGEERDIDEEEDTDIVYSDDPLPVGLVDIRRDDEERLEAAERSWKRKNSTITSSTSVFDPETE